jgi:predicted nucleic acid-binding protein
LSRDRHVVSDTGPLISLEKLGDGYRLLRLLYDKVLIPPSVLAEVIQGQFVDEQAYTEHYGISGFLQVVEAQSKRPLPESELLHLGETDAIRLALERDLPLLIEEEVGRRVAQQLGLHISGIAGQILKAFRNGTMPLPEANNKLRELLDAGRINKTIYEGLNRALQTS